MRILFDVPETKLSRRGRRVYKAVMLTLMGMGLFLFMVGLAYGGNPELLWPVFGMLMFAGGFVFFEDLKKLSKKLSHTTRRIAFMAVWLALVGIIGFLSMAGLANRGKPDYLIAAVSLLMFSIGVVTLWPKRQAGNPEQRTRKQADLWLTIGLLALVGVFVSYAFLQLLFQGEYLVAGLALLFLRGIWEAVRDVWRNYKKRL